MRETALRITRRIAKTRDKTNVGRFGTDFFTCCKYMTFLYFPVLGITEWIVQRISDVWALS